MLGDAITSKKGGKYGLLPHFFFRKQVHKWVKLIFRLVPFPKFYFLFFDTGLLFPRIRAPRASFKAVLMAVYITTKTLQTKCKTCFGGPRTILHAVWKNTVPKKQYGDPPPCTLLCYISQSSGYRNVDDRQLQISKRDHLVGQSTNCSEAPANFQWADFPLMPSSTIHLVGHCLQHLFLRQRDRDIRIQEPRNLTQRAITVAANINAHLISAEIKDSTICRM